MEPVLIFTDTGKIKEAKEMRDNHLDYLRDFYAELVAINIEVTLPQLISLAQFGDNVDISLQQKRVFSFVQNQLLEKAGTPDFNGVLISTNKLKDLIDVPNLDNLYGLLPIHYQLRRPGFGMIPECFVIDALGVEKSEQSDTVIEDMYTHYTRNDAGIALMQKLQPVCLALNSLNELTRIAMYRDGLGFTTAFSIPGVKFDYNNITFAADLKYVRDWEDSHPDFVLEE